MSILNKPKNNCLKSINYLIVSLITIGLPACTPTTPEESDAYFNQRFGPEYKINQTHLLVNWQGDAKHGIAPLKLNIPLVYLSGAVGENGEIRAITWALKPMKNGKIDTIYLALRRSNGKPVPYVSPYKTDDPEITRKQKEIYADEYVVQIFRDIYTGYAFNPNKDCCRSGRELFRGKDQGGLERYVQMQCYDVQELQRQALDPNYESSSKWTLKELANKPSYDITPANCLADARTDFWRSPINTPKSMAVKIDSSGTIAGFQMKILYKSHLVVAYPRENPEKMAQN